MKINDQVEPLMREALAASVARDAKRSAEAIQAMLDRGEDVFRNATGLCLAVDTFALLELHNGRPSEQRIQSLASSFADMEAWAEIDHSTAAKFLTALVNEPGLSETLPAEVTVRAAFAVGAWLLSAFPPEDRSWVDFLDEALDAIESAPDTTT